MTNEPMGTYHPRSAQPVRVKVLRDRGDYLYVQYLTPSSRTHPCGLQGLVRKDAVKIDGTLTILK